MIVLLKDFDEFFSCSFPQFKQHGPDKQYGYTYYLTYPDKNLAIVCEIPRTTQCSFLTDESIGSDILVYLKIPKGRRLIELTDTQRRETWAETLGRKVSVLVDLAEDEVLPCEKCGAFTVPFVAVNKKTSRNPAGTKFVGLRCPKCRTFYSTRFGIGLKKELHGFLK